MFRFTDFLSQRTNRQTTIFEEADLVEQDRLPLFLFMEADGITHRCTKKFLDIYNSGDIPEDVRRVARKLFRKVDQSQNPEEAGMYQWTDKPEFYEIRVGIHFRALARRVKTKNGIVYVWFWIGTREELNNAQHTFMKLDPDINVPNLYTQSKKPQNPLRLWRKIPNAASRHGGKQALTRTGNVINPKDAQTRAEQEALVGRPKDKSGRTPPFPRPPRSRGLSAGERRAQYGIFKTRKDVG
jgi:hypothetical protein